METYVNMHIILEVNQLALSNKDQKDFYTYLATKNVLCYNNFIKRPKGE